MIPLGLSTIRGPPVEPLDIYHASGVVNRELPDETNWDESDIFYTWMGENQRKRDWHLPI